MVWYNTGKSIFMDPRFNWGTAMPEPPFEIMLDVIWVALMQVAYVIDIDAHMDFADTGVATNEIVCTGYTARGDGVAMGGKGVTVNDTADRAEFDANDHLYSAIGNGTNDTFDEIILGRENTTTPTDASSPLIAHSTVSSTTTNGGDVTLVWHADGILQITA